MSSQAGGYSFVFTFGGGGFGKTMEEDIDPVKAAMNVRVAHSPIVSSYFCFVGSISKFTSQRISSKWKVTFV